MQIIKDRTTDMLVDCVHLLLKQLELVLEMHRHVDLASISANTRPIDKGYQYIRVWILRNKPCGRSESINNRDTEVIILNWAITDGVRRSLVMWRQMGSCRVAAVNFQCKRSCANYNSCNASDRVCVPEVYVIGVKEEMLAPADGFTGWWDICVQWR